MKIFAIIQNFQDYDHESWNHWKGDKTVDFFTTEEGASKEIGVLLNGEENVVEILEGTNWEVEGDIHQYPKFEIGEVIVREK